MCKDGYEQTQFNSQSTALDDHDTVDFSDNIILHPNVNRVDEINRDGFGNAFTFRNDDQEVPPLWLYDRDDPDFQGNHPEPSSSSHRVGIFPQNLWHPAISSIINSFFI